VGCARRGMRQAGYSEHCSATMKLREAYSHQDCRATGDTMLRIIASGEREDPPPDRTQSQPSLPL
jgi:hypothetical protein